MDTPITPHRYDYYALLAFALTAVASVSLQNFIWVCVVFFLFFHFKNSQKINWPINLFTIATLLFLLTFFIGALVGIEPVKSLQTINKYMVLLVVFPLGAMALSVVDIRKFLYLFLFGSSFCSAYGIFYKHFVLHEIRLDSFSGDKMVFGGMLMVSVIVNITLLKKNPKNYWLWFSLILTSVALLLTQTRGAWVGVLAGVLLLLWRFDKKLIFITLLALLAGYFVMPHTLQSRIKSIVDIQIYRNNQGQVIGATPDRLLIWIAGIQIIKDHPWGIGQGTLPDIYPQYRIPNPYMGPTEPHLHNDFLQILAQNGWLGLAVYLLWILAYYWMAFRFKTPDTETTHWNWMFLCIFSAILVWGLTEYTFSQQFMNIQFAFLGLQMNLWTQKPKLN